MSKLKRNALILGSPVAALALAGSVGVVDVAGAVASVTDFLEASQDRKAARVHAEERVKHMFYGEYFVDPDGLPAARLKSRMPEDVVQARVTSGLSDFLWIVRETRPMSEAGVTISLRDLAKGWKACPVEMKYQWGCGIAQVKYRVLSLPRAAGEQTQDVKFQQPENRSESLRLSQGVAALNEAWVACSNALHPEVRKDRCSDVSLRRQAKSALQRMQNTASFFEAP